MKLTVDTWLKLGAENLNLEEGLYLVLLAMEQLPLPEKYIRPNLETLLNKGFLNHTDSLSEAGKIFALTLIEEEEVHKTYTSDFEVFWKTFPASDQFAFFKETRKIRSNKKETFRAYLECVAEGYTPEFLLEKLQIDKEIRSNGNVMENPFKYMKGSQRWLEERVFLDIEKPEVYITADKEDLM